MIRTLGGVAGNPSWGLGPGYRIRNGGIPANRELTGKNLQYRNRRVEFPSSMRKELFMAKTKEMTPSLISNGPVGEKRQ
jgi:hypothetical protein